MPYKIFSSKILSSDDVNGYLMNQAVMTFEDANDRDASLVAPSEGMIAYLKDVDELQFHNGIKWNTFNITPTGNYLNNGDMRVSQRFGAASAGVLDGTYGLDRWISLGSGVGGVGSSGQTVTVTQDTDSPTGGLNSMRMTANTANLKFGCLQIIENEDIANIGSGNVTVSFKAKAGLQISDVRCAVLGWSGTADVVTRDIITTTGTPWLSTPPLPATNWTYYNMPLNLNVTGNWGNYFVNANVTGSPKNLAVFIWVNSTAHGTNRPLNITDVQLEKGLTATPFQRKTFQEELANCQRYYLNQSSLGITGAKSGADNFRVATVTYPVTMRITPTSTSVTSSSGTPYTEVPSPHSCKVAVNLGNTTSEVNFTSFTASADL